MVVPRMSSRAFSLLAESFGLHCIWQTAGATINLGVHGGPGSSLAITSVIKVCTASAAVAQPLAKMEIVARFATMLSPPDCRNAPTVTVGGPTVPVRVWTRSGFAKKRRSDLGEAAC